MSIPWEEANKVGSLISIKTVVNEFVAYQESGTLMASDAISPRSAAITSYALCGFANFSSVAILIGGIGGMAPARKAGGGQTWHSSDYCRYISHSVNRVHCRHFVVAGKLHNNEKTA